MTVYLQKAVTPGRESLWAAGDDLLVGYAVDAADVSWARTPQQLFDAHGLGFPGSPFSPANTVLDVLRFPVTPFVRAVNATGSSTDATGVPAGEGFVDHPPFTGNGFVATAERHIVPLWWLEPMRVPAGSELWRIHADGREELLAAYAHVAAGWQPGAGGSMMPSDVFGVFAQWRGARVMVDQLPNGRQVVAAESELPGLHLTERGLWAATVEDAQLEGVHALKLTASWRGLPFQVVRRWNTEHGLGARIVYSGRDSRAAEAAGLEKTDAAVYETTALLSDLTDVRGVELTSV